jgi:hypothetical protein
MVTDSPPPDPRMLAILRQDIARIEELMPQSTEHFAWKEIQARALSVHRAAAAIAGSEHAAYVRFTIDDMLKVGGEAEDHYREKLRHHLALLKSLLPGE